MNYQESGDNRPDGTDSHQDTHSASFRKLLCSHLSIYNALTNPDLDLNLANSPHLKERYTPPPLHFPVAIDPLPQLLLWLPLNVASEPIDLARQVVTASTSPRPQSASILSITSEEDNPSDSMVIVPSLKNLGSKVMVFETDEEDDADEYTYVGSLKSTYLYGDDKTLTNNGGIPRKHISAPTNLHSLFIMPKMSLSDSGKPVQLTILSTCNDALKVETQALIDYIKNNMVMSLKVQVHHLVIAQSPLKFDISVLLNSTLLFLVNDGSLLFVEFMDALLESGCQESLPKLTVINIMTTNYFINLFEMINNTRPHQIWKTPSLRSSKLLSKMNSYINEELGDGTSGRHAQAFKTRSKKYMKKRKPDHTESTEQSNSMYDSLTPTRKPDYKSIEKQIRSEMLMSLSYANIDPLQLSSNLNHLRALLGAFKRFFGSSSPDLVPDNSDGLALMRRHMWLICSFSVGIGVGVTVASGAVAFLGRGFTDLVKSVPPIQAGFNGTYQQLVAADSPVGAFSKPEMAGRLLEGVSECVGSISRVAVENLQVLADNSVVNSVINYLSFAIEELKSLGMLAIHSAIGGLRKSSNIVMGMVW